MQQRFQQKVQWPYYQLCLVGDSTAGKTSALRWLQSDAQAAEQSTESAELYVLKASEWRRDQTEPSAGAVQAALRNNPDAEAAAAEPVAAKQPQRVASTKTLALETQQRVPVAEPRHPDESAQSAPSSTTNKPPLAKAGSHTSTAAPRQSTHTSRKHTKRSMSVKAAISPAATATEDKDTQAIAARAFSFSVEKEPVWHVWDFGGQEEYFHTHHLYMSSASVFLLVVNATITPEATAESWMHRIRTYAPAAPVFLLLSHIDQLPGSTMDDKDAVAKEVERSVVAASVCCRKTEVNFVRERFAQLRVDLKATTTALLKTIPLGWAFLFDELQRKAEGMRPKTGTNVNADSVAAKAPQAWLRSITESEIRNLECVAKLTLVQDKDVTPALRRLRQLGFLLHFPTADGKDGRVFPFPADVVKMLRCVISTGVRLANGRMTRGELQRLWGEYDRSQYGLFEEMLISFRLALSDRRDPLCKTVLVPARATRIGEAMAAAELGWPHEALTAVFTLPTNPPFGLGCRLAIEVLNLAQPHDFELYSDGCRVTLSGVRMQIAFRGTAGAATEVRFQFRRWCPATCSLATLHCEQALEDLRRVLVLASRHQPSAYVACPGQGHNPACLVCLPLSVLSQTGRIMCSECEGENLPKLRRREGDLPLIFVSYHRDSYDVMRSLYSKLRHWGRFRLCRVKADGAAALPVLEWYQWVQERVEEAMWVLVLCDEAYARAVASEAASEADNAARFEGHYLCHRLLNTSKSRKFVLVTRNESVVVPPVLRRDLPTYALQKVMEADYATLDGVVQEATKAEGKRRAHVEP